MWPVRPQRSSHPVSGRWWPPIAVQQALSVHPSTENLRSRSRAEDRHFESRSSPALALLRRSRREAKRGPRLTRTGPCSSQAHRAHSRSPAADPRSNPTQRPSRQPGWAPVTKPCAETLSNPGMITDPSVDAAFSACAVPHRLSLGTPRVPSSRRRGLCRCPGTAQTPRPEHADPGHERRRTRIQRPTHHIANHRRGEGCASSRGVPPRMWCQRSLVHPSRTSRLSWPGNQRVIPTTSAPRPCKLGCDRVVQIPPHQGDPHRVPRADQSGAPETSLYGSA